MVSEDAFELGEGLAGTAAQDVPRVGGEEGVPAEVASAQRALQQERERGVQETRARLGRLRRTA